VISVTLGSIVGFLVFCGVLVVFWLDFGVFWKFGVFGVGIIWSFAVFVVGWLTVLVCGVGLRGAGILAFSGALEIFLYFACFLVFWWYFG